MKERKPENFTGPQKLFIIYKKTKYNLNIYVRGGFKQVQAQTN